MVNPSALWWENKKSDAERTNLQGKGGEIMASLSTDKAGKRRILFMAPDGDRKMLWLGRVSQRKAETFKVGVENILDANSAGAILDASTAAWLANLDDATHDKLAKLGLVAPRNSATVGGLLADFIAANTHVKPATRVMWRHTIRNLREYFGDPRPLRTIGTAEAEGFRQGLVEQKLAAATVSRRLQLTRQIFGYAVRCEWLDRNPFTGISHTSGDPRLRQHYVTEEETALLIDAAPNWVWRTIIALARYGGLRTPSETLSLRIADLDWERGAMTVISPKTENHGHGHRAVPMFARLRPFLEEAWNMAQDGQTHVIPETLYLPAAHGPNGWVNMNLRTTFAKIVKRAGLEPWPRLFHALRASCESDLAREYPITTACKWIGNTVSIAARHYIQVTDDDFRRASGCAHFTAQQAPERGCTRRQQETRNPGFSGVCEPLRHCTTVQMGDDGLEPPTSTL